METSKENREKKKEMKALEDFYEETSRMVEGLRMEIALKNHYLEHGLLLLQQIKQEIEDKKTKSTV